MISPDLAVDLLAEPKTRALMTCLNEGGEEARIVGGAVRNALIGHAGSDIDIGTTALPDVVIARVRAMGWKAVPTGLSHGTITVVIEGTPFEVTSLREDIATDGRHAEVRFGRDFKTDAARRDFTINALGLDSAGRLHDYFGGLADLEARLVRFIGDPDQRLREDYLRGLRFLRFTATFGENGLDPAGLNAVLRNRQGFAGLSRERIRQEMLKLLIAPRAAEIIAESVAHGLISELCGMPVDVPRMRNMIAREPGANAIHRLYALAVPIAGEPGVSAAQRLAASLRLSSREEAVLTGLARLMNLPIGPHLPRHIAFAADDLPHLGLWDARIALILRALEGYQTQIDLDAVLLALPETAPRFLISGADIMALGIHAGPQLGQALAEVRARWIGAGLPDGKDAQRVYLPPPA